MLRVVALILLFFSTTTLVAKGMVREYGVRGHTFVIKERSLLDVIQERLRLAEKSGKIASLQKQFQNRVKQKIMHPTPVAGIIRTVNERSWTYDPTYTQPADVRDHLGNIVVKSGTTVNPLDSLSWREPFLFIDGDDEEQLQWAEQREGNIILVKGSPIKLMEKYGRWFYFDQAGVLVHKFGIQQVPAQVAQEGKVLKIKEIRL